MPTSPGLGILDLLHASTYDKAEQLGLENVGRLAPGWPADTLIPDGRLNGDILRSLA